MAKLLLFVVVVAVIWFLVRATRRKATPPPERSAASEAMVSCAHCGVHFPSAESFRSEGRDYCCEEHRRLGAGS